MVDSNFIPLDDLHIAGVFLQILFQKFCGRLPGRQTVPRFHILGMSVSYGPFTRRTQIGFQTAALIACHHLHTPVRNMQHGCCLSALYGSRLCHSSSLSALFGGSSNNTHIGVEMCEPACIKYTGGASFTCSDRESALAMVKRTYDTAVELFAFLCGQFSLDPLADGVIVSHKEGHARGIASGHHISTPIWVLLELPPPCQPR